MSSSSSSSSGGTSILGLLGVAFVVLKLTGVISWSWWYVTMPFWGGLVLLLSVLLIYLIIIGFNGLIKKRKYEKRMKEIREKETKDSIELPVHKKRGFQDRLSKALEEQRRSTGFYDT